MIRWVMFVFGSGLLILSSFLLNYREKHVADSRSVLGYRENIQVYPSEYDLIEVNFLHQEKILVPLAKAPDWYQSSPDGAWLLLTTTDYPTSEIYLMSRSGAELTQIREPFMLIDRPLWSPVYAEFVYVEAHEETLLVFHCNADGDIIDQYEVNWDGKPWWILEWLDGNTIELINLSAKPSYVIDLPSGVVQSTERYIDMNPSQTSRISPDDQFRFIDEENSLALTADWDTAAPQIVWQVDTPALQWRDSPIWSDDSTRIALISKTEADAYRGDDTTNIFVISSTDGKLTQLTNDERRKYFIINSPGDYTNDNPFSYTNEWVLFASQAHDFAIRHYHVVRTDGSQEEISNLISDTGSSDSLRGVRWLAPPPDQPINQNMIALGGLFILSSLVGSMFRRLIL